MAKSIISTKRLRRKFLRWLLEKERQDKEGAYSKEGHHRQHPW